MIQMLILSVIAKLRIRILEMINDKEKCLCFDTHTKQAILSIIDAVCAEVTMEELKNNRRNQ